jgi:periplasmic protein TonB
MPLNVKRCIASFIMVFILATTYFAQDDVMRQRIARARAYVAVKNYNAAVYELDGIRRDSKDETVQGVALTMLMSVYLEQGDYRRAQDLLVENFNNQKLSKKPSSTYYSVAGQVVRGSRNQIERYRQLGLSLNDRNLPTEAVADVEKMRETLELIIKQSEELADLKKQPNESFALVEEASNARGNMARDDFDSTRWKNKISDTRERMANSSAKVVNVVEDAPKPTPTPNTVAMATPLPTPQPTIIPVSTVKNDKNDKNNKNKKPTPTPTPQISETIAKVEPTPTPTPRVEITPTIPKVEPVPTPTPVIARVEPTPIPTPTIAKVEPTPEVKPTQVTDPLSSPNLTASNGNENSEISKNTNVEPNTNGNSNTTEPKITNPPIDNSSGSLDVGSLVGYAVQTTKPTYPPIAKQMRLAGIVRVSVTVNENGEVTDAESISGPAMLKRPALDAAKRWKFRPFVREGQPTKATGYIDFNFAP